MENKVFIVNLPIAGSSWVSVDYLQNHPVYYIRSLENKMKDLIVFISRDGKWQQDGVGITPISEAIGNAIIKYEIE